MSAAGAVRAVRPGPAALVLLALLLVLGAARVELEPAADVRPHAQHLQVSRGGKHWSARLVRPVFSHDVVLVPGETRNASFLVRNNSRVRARLQVRVLVRDPEHWLRSNRLRMRVRTGNGPWVRTRDQGQRGGIVVARAHQVIPVKVRINLRPGARNSSADRHLSFSLRVRLTPKRQSTTKGHPRPTTKART